MVVKAVDVRRKVAIVLLVMATDRQEMVTAEAARIDLDVQQPKNNVEN